MSFHSGQLFIVATPIGNLADITLRALDTLREVDLICAEDTRHSRKLLQKYEIAKHLVSFHSHSSDYKIEKMIAQLQKGKNIALVSDAGTPGISDPGFKLIQSAIEKGIRIIPIPGATAAITALCAAGLPTDKFVYLGFPPTKKGRQTLFRSLQDETRTVVFYESPYRIVKAISQLMEILGPERKVVLASELTKIHENFWRGNLEEAVSWLRENPPRGEYVIVLEGVGC